MFERFFQLRRHGTNVRTEVLAGLTTFLTMAYIVFLQPSILSGKAFEPGIPTGLDFGAVMTATCLSAALATAIMALYASGIPGALRIGSAILAVFCIGFPASQVRRTVHFHRQVPELFQGPVLWGVLTGYLTVATLSIVHASGVLGDSPAIVFIGLLWPLFQSALQFARMLFIRPQDPDADD